MTTTILIAHIRRNDRKTLELGVGDTGILNKLSRQEH